MALPVLSYREPEIINSCTELGKILKKEKSSSVLVVTDKGIVNNGLLKPIEDVLNTGNIPYAVYDDTLPNPTVKNVEDALKLYNKLYEMLLHMFLK
jgi:alcohol dehydrogenase class IV